MLFSYSSAHGLSSASPANLSSSLVGVSGDGTRLAAAGVYNEASLTELGVQVSTNLGASWQSVLTNVGITLIALSADGRTLVAGAKSNVIFLSTNFGMTWSTNIVQTPLSDFLGPWDAVACSADGARIFATSGSGPFATSSDAGKNWSSVVNNFQSIAVSGDGSQLLAADEQ